MNKQNKKSRRIGIYIRVSTEEQAENPEGSIRNQEDRLRMTVKLKNMEGHFGDITAVYIDRAKSGKDTNRPELQKMLMAIRKRELDLVMVSELSRISRSIKDFSEIWQLMQDNDCGFQSLRENFDTTTAAGEMVLFTVANIAQFERRQISERVSANFNVRSQRGLFNGGPIPFGYKKIDDKPGYLELDEEAAKSVQAAFHAIVREGSLAPAASWLNEQGFRMKTVRADATPRSKLGYFTVKNLWSMVRSKFYAGIKVYSYNNELKEAEAVWPPIVDRETYEKANEILNKNHRRNKERMIDRHPYLLSGIIYCKSCGNRLIGRSGNGNSGKVCYYEHSPRSIPGVHLPNGDKKCFPFRVSLNQIEAAMWEEILNLLLDEKFGFFTLHGGRQ